MKYDVLIRNRNERACEHAIHKATRKRKVVTLANLLNLLLDTRHWSKLPRRPAKTDCEVFRGKSQSHLDTTKQTSHNLSFCPGILETCLLL